MKKIKQAIDQVIDKLELEKVDYRVEHPKVEEHGDYSTNIAMILGKMRGEDPKKLAQKIVKKLETLRLSGLSHQSKDAQDDKIALKKFSDLVKKIEVKEPGFINFWLKEEWLIEQVSQVINEKNDYGRGEWGKGRRMLIDYSSPNIAKRFTVGHLRSTIIGQAVRNLYEFSGWETVGDNHLGDWGTQFGMIIAAVEEGERDIAKMSVEEMEEMYVQYNRKAKEDESYLAKAREAFARLEKGDLTAREIWRASVEASMREFGKIYDLLGVEIEHAYGESSYEQLMPEVIKEAKEKGVAKESQGAWVIEYEDLPTAVLVKSDGATNYLTRDLATIKFRESKEELRADLYIYEVGSEQSLHFKQVFAASQMMGWVERERFYHLGHGLVLGKDGKKLSTRRGTSRKLEDLLKAVIEKAGKINPETAEIVGVGAVKYADLKHDPKTTYVFDMEKALDLKGDSGPYLQYTYARARSVLSKAEKVEMASRSIKGEIGTVELDIARWIYRFPEIVEEAARGYSTHLLASYLYELAGKFNTFYNQERIIGSGQERVRLGLTQAVAQILENGFGLLGIEAPQSM